MKKLLLITSMISVFFIGNAQNRPGRCGTPILPAEYENWMQEKIKEFESLQQSGRTQLFYDIPVVVHVINNGEAIGTGSNISVAQINSQITILNQDYRKTNADTNLIPAAFKPMAADININFHLATVDPSGNPTTGIDRINRNTHSWTAPPYVQSYINGTIKPATIWNTTHYLNMWVLALDPALLGYATFPPGSGLSGITGVGSATTDGVVITHSGFGNTGTAAYPYNKGRSATHEVGHWLGLRHIWGDGSCGPPVATDYCNDTPSQDGENYGCPTYPLIVANSGQGWFGPSCSGTAPGSMFMNYMDYVDDRCMMMFSNDQKTRMQTAMANSPMRNQLSTGIAENQVRLDNIKVYPNPTKGDVSVSIPNLRVNSDVDVSIINILGKTVYHQNFEANHEGVYNLNLSSLNSGLYIVEVKNEKGTLTQRIDLNK